MAGFIGNSSYRICGKHDSTQQSESSQIGMHVHKACAGLCWSLKDVIRPGERYEGLKNSFRPNACRSGLRNLIGGGTLSRVSCRPTRYATLMPLFAG